MQIKVWLDGVSPMTWRRVRVPGSITLRELHGVIQVTIGWEGLHLYRFLLRAGQYRSLELGASSPEVSLAALRMRQGARFVYEYDLLCVLEATVWNTTLCPAVKLLCGLCRTTDNHDLARTGVPALYLIFIPLWVDRRPMANCSGMGIWRALSMRSGASPRTWMSCNSIIRSCANLPGPPMSSAYISNPTSTA